MRLTEDQAFGIWGNRGRWDECWVWTGSTSAHGYGRFDGEYTHRRSFREAHGSIPEGAWICHTCDNPPCWNPDHLYAGNASTNAQDREDRGRGRSMGGEHHPRGKLTWTDVREIRQAWANGESQASLSRRFPVGDGQINRIVRNLRWIEKPAGQNLAN